MSKRVPISLILILVIVCLINIGGFRATDEHFPASFQALAGHESKDFVSHAGAVQRLVAPYYFFGRAFPGSRLILPKRKLSAGFDIGLSFLAFGSIENIRYIDYDPARFVDVASISSDGRTHPLQGYLPNDRRTMKQLAKRIRILTTFPDSRSFLLVVPDGETGREIGPLYLVDTHLLSAEQLRELSNGR